MKTIPIYSQTDQSYLAPQNFIQLNIIHYIS